MSISGPIEIGQHQEYLSARIQNAGCLKFDLSWTADAAAGMSMTFLLNLKFLILPEKHSFV